MQEDPIAAARALEIALAHHEGGRLHEAEKIYRQAIQLAPGNAVVHYNLGNALQGLGRLAEAESSYAQALALHPGFAEAHYNRGNMLKALGRLEEAQRSFADAAVQRPDFAEAHNNRGTVLADLGRLREAEQSYRRALAAKPAHALAHNNLGNALRELGRIEEAESSYRQALALKPDLAAAHNHLGNVLRDLGRLDEAERSYRRALELDPGAFRTHSNLAFLLNYIPGRSAAEIYSEHLAFGRRFPGVTGQGNPANTPDRGRKLRIGYVSGDLRDHAVAYFIEPVLANHLRGEYEVFCYYNFLRADDVTARLKRHADHWRDVAQLDDEALASLIRSDRIDILVDLAGHTAHNRLPVFARRPAPVQATWLGYLNTTGMNSMDYRITDAVATPAGELDSRHSEALVRLPDSQWCYQPPAGCPDVGPLPCASADAFTFAVFTTPPKVGDRTIALWCDLLDRVPGSRLRVVYAILATVPEAQRARFARLGIGPDRLELLGSQSFGKYLELHRSADLILDTSPYAGGTTTCHALWMGVPVVSLAGETATSSGGASLLHAAGLAELVARTPEQYLDIAARLAGDRPRLARLRQGLRERMAASPLMDAARFTQNLESAYREMWGRWCRAGGQ